ncbi:MAG TPA: LysE family transporter [Gammaproteobacteria bacterium]|nr:LysE family transporter [Gammaproteobacteria bacterium]
MQDFLLTFLGIASLHFLAVTSPGPDFILATKNALLYPKRQAILTALGISLGIVIHVTYCILGFAVIIAKSIVLFTIIKLLGACYLIYIGIKACLAKDGSTNSTAQHTTVTSPISGWQALKQGFLCNLLNPKATLFFLGLFTLAIKPTTPAWMRIFYGAWMVGVTFLWFTFISLLIANPHVRSRILRIQPIVTKVMGVLLVFFGLDLALFSFKNI